MDDRARDIAAVERIRSATSDKLRAALTNAFVASKEGLIRKLVHKAAAAEKTSAPIEDLYQAGRMALMRALRDWDPDKGALSTHAGWWVKNHVQSAARAEQTITLPRIRLTTEERTRVILALRKNPDVTAESLGVQTGALEQVKRSFGLRFLSVDMFSSDAGDDAAPRARRIERRISESAESDEPEDVADKSAAASRFVDAARSCMSTFAVDAPEIVMLLSRALGLAEKTSPASPHARQPKWIRPCPNCRRLNRPKPHSRNPSLLDRSGPRSQRRPVGQPSWPLMKPAPVSMPSMGSPCLPRPPKPILPSASPSRLAPPSESRLGSPAPPPKLPRPLRPLQLKPANLNPLRSPSGNAWTQCAPSLTPSQVSLMTIAPWSSSTSPTHKAA